MAVMTTTTYYVCSLPFEVKKQLCAVLDSKNMWEALALGLQDLTAPDVEACRGTVGFGSPAETLLTIWGAKGNTVLQLYNSLARLRMVSAMRVLRNYVDSRFHHWEELCRKPLNQASTSNLRTKDFIVEPYSDGQGQQNGTVQSTIKTTLNHTISHTTQFSNMTDEGDVMVGLQSTINVKYHEVLLATANFSEKNILGKGGYGTAYKGVWKNFEVAVKRFRSQRNSGNESLKERLRQSLHELRTLAKYRHDNILPLYGISLDGEDPCLIYQYMANGSLEDRLQRKGGTEVLTWQQRKIIAEGSARGLLFLHTGSDTPIIHGDIKTANILLDRHFEPKLGDFGLCRYGPLKEGIEDMLIASHVKGTYPYLPPEFTKSKIMSTKLDIYSFGVVLLEVASGSKVYLESREQPNLLQHVLHLEAEAEHEYDMSNFIKSVMDKDCPGDDEESLIQELKRLGRESKEEGLLRVAVWFLQTTHTPCPTLYKCRTHKKAEL